MSTFNNPHPLKVGDPGAVIDSTIPSRRLFNFSDRVADLAPEESPFFVYLSKVAKVPTDDPQFRWLKDRNKIDMTDRSFRLAAAHTVPAAGSTLTYTVETGNNNIPAKKLYESVGFRKSKVWNAEFGIEKIKYEKITAK